MGGVRDKERRKEKTKEKGTKGGKKKEQIMYTEIQIEKKRHI
jgi:hypothetical protein